MSKDRDNHNMSLSMTGRSLRRVLAVMILLAAAGGFYVWGVWNGWFLLNHPPIRQYPVRGVDVSHYQGLIDWEVLSRQDITFAYIKATEGSSHTDERFEENWDKAGKTELKTGAYHFFSFDSPGLSQAAHFIQTVQIRDGMLPPVVDFEFYGDKKVNPPPVEETADRLRSMLEELKGFYGMTPVLYATEEAYDMYLKARFDEYPLWIRNVIRKPDTDRPWIFWQYTNRGRLDGYTGDEKFIDLNVFCGSREQWDVFVQEGIWEK